MNNTNKRPATEATPAEPQGEKRATRWKKGVQQWVHDPMIKVRARTAVRGSLAVLAPTLLVYSANAFNHFPSIAIVLCSHFTITLMAHSIAGVVGIGIQSLKGGVVGCFFGYIAYLAAPYLGLQLLYLFIFCLIVGLYDPYLKQGIFVKWSIVDFFVILFTPQYFNPHSVLYGSVMLFVVAHGFSLVIAIVSTLLIWPSLSSREFAQEFKLALQLTSDVFKLVSYRIDREVLKQRPNSTNIDAELETVLHVHGLPDKDIKELEKTLSLKLIRLRRLMNESRAETWNPKIPNNDKLLEYLNNLYHNLTNMHSAINAGKFSSTVQNSFLSPMLPFMENLQQNIIHHFDNLLLPSPASVNVHSSTKLTRREAVTKVLEAVDFEESVRVMDTEYSSRVRSYETQEGGRANPSHEVSRLAYIIFGAVDFAHTLHDMEQLYMKMGGEDKRSGYRVIWEGIFTDAVWHFNLFPNPSPSLFVKEFATYLKNTWADIRKLTWRSAWNSPLWRFPIRLSVGITVISLILFAIPSKDTVNFPYYTPLWACLTYVVVVLPTLGATMRKCVHRFGGTILGAFIGHGFLVAVLSVHHSAQPFVHIFLLVPYFFFVVYLQQIPAFGYSATVAGLTFLTIFIGQYQKGQGDIKYAYMRGFFIVVGILWAFIVGNLFFPSKSSITYTRTLVDTLTKISSIFSNLIERGTAEAHEETQAQQEEIAKAIKGIHSNYLSMRNNLKEAKSELFWTWSGYVSYKHALQQAHKAYYTLSNMNTLLGHHGFSPELVDVVNLLRSHLQQLVVPVVESADRIRNVFDKKQHVSKFGDHYEAASTVLHNIDREYFNFRKTRIEQKTLANLHPAIRQVTTFLYLIREFVMEWRILIETVNNLMGLPIEVIPIEMTTSDDTTTTQDSSLDSGMPSPSFTPSPQSSYTPASPRSQPDSYLLPPPQQSDTAV